jgi:hypothetical protein
MPLPKDIDGLSPAELKSLVLRLLEKLAELERTVAAQRDEIARLKGGPPRPNIKPSGMEQTSNPKPPGSSNKRRRGSTRSMLSIDEVAQHARAGVTGRPGAHPLFSAAASASHSRRQSAAASPVIIRLTPARINLGPRPAFHSEYRKLRLTRCALQNSATVNAIGSGGPVDSDSLLIGAVLVWRWGACSNDKLNSICRR